MTIFLAGYWGDIVVSPYISFGIECDEETMFKKANRDYVNSSEQITQHNLSSMTHELHTGEVRYGSCKRSLLMSQDDICDRSCRYIPYQKKTQLKKSLRNRILRLKMMVIRLWRRLNSYPVVE